MEMCWDWECSSRIGGQNKPRLAYNKTVIVSRTTPNRCAQIRWHVHNAVDLHTNIHTDTHTDAQSLAHTPRLTELEKWAASCSAMHSLSLSLPLCVCLSLSHSLWVTREASDCDRLQIWVVKTAVLVSETDGVCASISDGQTSWKLYWKHI